MSSELEQFEKRETENKLKETSESLRSADAIRGSISGLLQNEDFRRTLDPEALKNYEDMLRGQGKVKLDDAGQLARIHKFMVDEYEKVVRVQDRFDERIKEAIRSKVISEKDKGFYEEKIEQNVLNGKQIVTQETMEKAERELQESLKKRLDERRAYDAIAQDPLVRDGKLLVAKGKTISVPDEKAYLDMKVPERRKWLKEIKDALPKAKRYQEKEGDVESQRLGKEYETLLENAQKEGVIGKATAKKFMEGFKKIDLKEKEYWLKELSNGNQLKRYRELWKEARKTLSDVGFRRLVGQKDRLGYSELMTALGQEKDREGKMMEDEYGKKLSVLQKQKIISRHTQKAFLEDVQRQPLEKKKEYLQAFDTQMQRYKALRVKIDQMKDGGAKKTLDEMYERGECGYSEINAKYQRLAGQSVSVGSISPQQEEAERELDAIENRSVRRALKAGMKTIEKSQKKNLVERLTNFFEGRLSANVDPLTYQKTLKEARSEHRQVNIKEIREHHRTGKRGVSQEKKEVEEPEEEMGRANTIAGWELKDDIAALDQEMNEDGEPVTKEEYKKKLPRRAKTEVNSAKTFIRKTFYTESNEERHVMRAQLNSKEGVRSLNSVTNIDRQKDDLSLNVWADNRAIELKKLDDVRAFVHYLRKDISAVTNKTERLAA